MIEDERLRCILISHKSMEVALSPLMDESEHPRVRLEAAFLAVVWGLEEGDPDEALFELAEGSGAVARMARGLIGKWNREGWPNFYPYDEESGDAGIGGDSGTMDWTPE